MARAKTRRAARLTALAALALLLSVVFWRPAFWAYPRTQWGDGQQAHKMLEAARVSVVRYHELPLWNPYECGGIPLWDNPVSFVGAPFAWLAVPFGTTSAILALYILHTTIGFMSMWLLARYDLRLSRVAAFVASATWAYCGFHQHHDAGGHITFTPFQYLPLALFLWRAAEKDLRYAVGLGALIADMMYEGAVYPIPHFALILGVETLTRVLPKERFLRIVKAAAVAGVFAFALGASRFLPVIDQLRHHTRALEAERDSIRWSTLKDMFLARTHPFRFARQKYHWNEYGAYLGPFLLFLGVLGVFTSGAGTEWLVLLLAVSASLMMGHLGRYAPWHLLKQHVFPFKEMRVPSRFVAEVSMFLAAFVGIAVDRVPRLLRARFPRSAWVGQLRAGMVAVALIGIGDMIGVGTSFIDEFGFHEAPETHPVPSNNLYLGGQGLASLINQPQQNRGRVQCWDEWAFNSGAPLWEGDVPQAQAVDDGATVLAVTRTQNTFVLDVDVTRQALVRLNTTYDRGFRTNAGTLVALKKQLALNLPPGRHHVLVKYWPSGLTAGFAVSGVSTALVIGFFVWDRRRRRLA
jgi:hypothetical protein